MDGETFIFDEEFGNKKLSLNPIHITLIVIFVQFYFS